MIFTSYISALDMLTIQLEPLSKPVGPITLEFNTVQSVCRVPSKEVEIYKTFPIFAFLELFQFKIERKTHPNVHYFRPYQRT